MEVIESNLAFIWLMLIGFFLLYYAITDGADLGVGILSLFASGEEERQEVMGSISSVWHGNQTWLVILGGMLFGAFPLFFSVVLSSLYIPFVLMLFGLVFRGVAFEFHDQAHYKPIWTFSFGMGSLIVTLAQGFALGGLLRGLSIEDGQFTGSVWDWLTPYSIFVTCGVLLGYLMLGSNFLILRSEGQRQLRYYRYARISGVLTFLVSAGVHLWTSILHPEMTVKWSSSPQSPMTILVLLTVVSFFMYFRSLRNRQRLAPYLWNGLVIILSFTGLSIGLYPQMIPGVVSPVMTVQEAAASPKTLKFMLVMMTFVLPVILAYTSYSYWVFRHREG